MLRTISPTADAPPPYTRAPPPHSSTSSAANSLFSSDTTEGYTYKYTSNAVSLNFSQAKVEGVRLPAFGREGIIAGEVSLRSSSHIESVSVSLRGEVKTIIESSCTPTLSSATTLLDESHVLWSKSGEANASAAPRLLPFSLVFPSTTKNQNTPLPPSFVGAIAEATTRVRYKIVVTVRRLGWRSNASVETEILHLPRFPDGAVSSSSLASDPGQPPLESPYDLKIVPLATNRIISGKTEPSQVNAHLAYPSLVSLSRDRSVSFNILLSSLEQPPETLLALAPHIFVRLIRTVRVTARGSTFTKETVVCQKSVRASEALGKSGNPVLNLSGCIDVPKDIWRTLTIPGAIKITYYLRVSLPASVRPDVAYIDQTESLVLVAGNEFSPGHPDAPDLEAMPSPSSLLKTPPIYMPMDKLSLY